MLSDNQKIGVLLTGIGVVFLIFGILLFFDRGLLALGNLLFLIGITLSIGPMKTGRFFAQRRKIRGTVLFGVGIFLVLSGRTFIGICIESFGFLNLFGDFFPVVLGFLRSMPFIGTFLNLPFVSKIADYIAGTQGGSLPV